MIQKIKTFLYHLYRGSFHDLPTYGSPPGLGIVTILMVACVAAGGWAGLFFSVITFLPIFLWGSYERSVEDPEVTESVEVETKQQQVSDTDVYFTWQEVQDIADTLSVAMGDIRELLQVAKYNLRGQINTGEIIDKPNPPLLIHEAGIAKSEATIERCRKMWLLMFNRFNEEQNDTNKQDNGN
jgi:hypothetical protein